MIRLASPSVYPDDLQAVQEVLSSGYLVQGPKVASFERAVAERTGARYAVATNSCTSALQLSLLAHGIRPGDDVLVPAYSWVATANVVLLAGAQPIFVDIDPQTFCMDPDALEKVIHQYPHPDRLRAIVPVHAFGRMADMARINRIAASAGLAVIEDAACALGASDNGRAAGSWGEAGCFSFHPRKTITTGEGGMVVTDDEAVANKLRALRNHGLDPESGSPDFVMPGFNMRMTEMQGALGLRQLQKLDQLLAMRQRIGRKYDALFHDSEVMTPEGSGHASHAMQSYVVLLPKGVDRDRVIGEMRSAGIETTIGTWHIPMTRYYRERFGFRTGDYPATDEVFERSLSLPLHESIDSEDQESIARTLRCLIQGC